MARSVLVIDDEISILQSLSGVLSDEGFKVTSARSGVEGLEKLQIETPDAILLDIWMPEMDGLEVLNQIRKKNPNQTVIMMSGHGNIETAVKATKLGAFDFVEKPLSLEKLLVLLNNAMNLQDLKQENAVLKKQTSQKGTLIGQSPAMKQIREMIRRVAPTTGSILITGENGTGKELIARAIHLASPRFDQAMVEVNCAAIPEELIESELFGHEKGAFTGATQLRRGRFDVANKGTLFLDEIGDMSLKTQAKILRILQEQKFERVGGAETISVDVRVIAATNKDLKDAIKQGSFREDLYYRLNVIPFHVPALRDRQEDIRPLAETFLGDSAQSHGRKPRTLTPEALAALEQYSWPGNVRELKNLIERIMILTSDTQDGTAIVAAAIFDHLKEELSGLMEIPAEFKKPISINPESTPPKNLRDARQQFEKDFILKTLKENNNNISKTALALGVERSHLSKKIKSYGIDV